MDFCKLGLAVIETEAQAVFELMQRIDERFEPAHATLTIGQISGGTASNILAAECRFVFDLRTPPSENPEAILAPFIAECAEISARRVCLGSRCSRVSRHRSEGPLARSTHRVR